MIPGALKEWLASVTFTCPACHANLCVSLSVGTMPDSWAVLSIRCYHCFHIYNSVQMSRNCVEVFPEYIVYWQNALDVCVDGLGDINKQMGPVVSWSSGAEVDDA